jgi:predicted permease
LASPPALRASESDPALLLRQSSRNVTGGAEPLGKALIVAQIAVSFVLLLGAGLLAQTFQKLYSIDLGIDKGNLLEVTLSPRPSGYRDLDMNTYHKQLVKRISAIPGVRSVSFSDARIPSQEGWRDIVSTISAEPGTGPMVNSTTVAPSFLQTLGIHLIDGRDFDWNDDDRHPFVAIVNRNLAERLFQHGHAIGERIRFGVFPDFQSLEIVGIADDARIFDLRNQAAFTLYLPSLQHSKLALWGNLFIRARVSPETLTRQVTYEVESLGHEYVIRTRSVSQATNELLVTEHATAALSGVFAGLAVLMACVGLYGLMSYTVTRRMNEIGIRTALGAQRRNILWVILREAISLGLLGIMFGLPCSLGACPRFSIL